MSYMPYLLIGLIIVKKGHPLINFFFPKKEKKKLMVTILIYQVTSKFFLVPSLYKFKSNPVHITMSRHAKTQNWYLPWLVTLLVVDILSISITNKHSNVIISVEQYVFRISENLFWQLLRCFRRKKGTF